MRPYHPNALLELHAEDKSWPLRGRSLHRGYGLRNSQERCTHNPLCTKHFHEISSASPHTYSPKSHYGKLVRFRCHGTLVEKRSKNSVEKRWMPIARGGHYYMLC